MHCSNCLEKMEETVLDGQKILHCSNCGASFFEENGINRISINSAKELAQDKKGPFNLDTKKLCPKDNQTVLMQIRGDAAIPEYVSLLKCATCRGIFVSSNDLVLFKKAQDVKIEFFKVWGNPLPSLRSVLVLSFLAVVGFSLFATSFFRPSNTITSSQAEDVITNVNITKSSRYIFVSFKTQISAKSKIALFDKTTGKTVTKDIADQPTQLHYVTITDLPVNDQITYQIMLTDTKGTEVKTKETLLDIK